MKIYTKTGDKGQTSLFGGDRISKDAPQLRAYGTSDELNALLGVICCELREQQKLQRNIEKIQHQLFLIGSHLACGDESLRGKLPTFDQSSITDLETQIDSMNAELAPLKEFILPGGSKPAAYTHLARTVCRRFERQLVSLETFPGHDQLLIYVNRLSDYLFTFARYLNWTMKCPDIPWKK